MAKNPKKDDISGVETTGHDWDGIQELNKPTPRWWLIVFLFCVIWSFGYWFFYPTWPISGGNTKGSLDWTQHKELAHEQLEIEERKKEKNALLRNSSLQQIKADKELYEFAKAGGMANFKQNCIMCHGSDAAGSKGYPNLNDDDWLWGGKLEDIYKTIQVGIRSEHQDARSNQMPSFGHDGILTHKQISDVADYVVKLSDGDKAETTPAYISGKEIFANNCTACHGTNGVGNKELGAPRLSDKVWLYAHANAAKEDIRTAIINSVTNAHAGVMPAWEKRLSDEEIKSLTIYVHSLGGGE